MNLIQFGLLNYKYFIHFIIIKFKKKGNFYLNNNIFLKVLGKDILKFHTIYWPAFLFSLGK
jgi:methionyl-tRNA synthetase